MHVQAALKNKKQTQNAWRMEVKVLVEIEEARSVDRRESGFDQNTLHVWNYQ